MDPVSSESWRKIEPDSAHPPWLRQPVARTARQDMVNASRSPPASPPPAQTRRHEAARLNRSFREPFHRFDFVSIRRFAYAGAYASIARRLIDFCAICDSVLSAFSSSSSVWASSLAASVSPSSFANATADPYPAIS